MEYKSLGSSIKISTVGFGCMSLKASQQENDSLIQTAIDNGINFFDTADLYEKGENEIILGKAVKEKRKDIIIASKVGNKWKEDGSGWEWAPDKKYIKSAVEESLKRLQTDYIDLYQLHGGTMEDPIDEIIEAFEELKQAGKIRLYGISSIRPQVIRTWIEHASLSSIMLQYSLLDRRAEEAILNLAAHNSTSVLARGVFAQGLLVNKQPQNYLQWSKEDVEKILNKIDDLKSPSITRLQSSLYWVLSNPVITSAVIGMRTMSQLKDIISAIKNMNLPYENSDRFNHEIPVLKYELHR